jgi:nucleoside-diphosphate-sugar epimerase
LRAQASDPTAPLAPAEASGHNRAVFDLGFDAEAIRARPWVILGCGYTGLRLAKQLLAAGARVWVTRRNQPAANAVAITLASAAAQGDGAVIPRALDLDGDESPCDLSWLPRQAWLVHAAPPGEDLNAERRLVEAAAQAQIARIIYLSSTSVYPLGDGGWIDEDSPTGPPSDRGVARLRAESDLLEIARGAGISAVSLRIVGIYGPGRGVPLRLYRDSYRIIGDGNTYVNRVHVDDLGRAIVAAALIDPLPREIYLVADDQPETSRVYADAVATAIGKPSPPAVPTDGVPQRVVAMLTANRRIRNERMKSELSVELVYPTWREGLVQVLVEDGIPQVQPIPGMESETEADAADDDIAAEAEADDAQANDDIAAEAEADDVEANGDNAADDAADDAKADDDSATPEA